MARFTDGDRRLIRLTKAEREEVKRLAEKHRMTQSEVLRGIVDRFLAHGTKLTAQPTRAVTMLIENEVAERAEEKARESGVTLRDVIRDELGVIYRRPQ